jgi:hypothetical protein
MDSIAAEMRAYPNINYRYLFMQENGAGGKDEINFNPSNTWPLQLSGRQQAQEALAYGPGYGFDHYFVDGVFNRNYMK